MLKSTVIVLLSIAVFLIVSTEAGPFKSKNERKDQLEKQAGLGGGTGILAALSLLSLPTLPLLLLAPLAINGVNDALSSYNENQGAIDDILNTVSSLAQGSSPQASESNPKPTIVKAPTSGSASTAAPSIYNNEITSGLFSQLSSIDQLINNLGSSSANGQTPSSIQSFALNAFNNLSSLLLNTKNRFRRKSAYRYANNRNDFVPDMKEVRQIPHGIQMQYNTENWCQQRLMCEMNQKPVRRSLRAWTDAFVNLIGLKNRGQQGSMDMAVDTRRASKQDKCLMAYLNCPMPSKVAPLSVSFQRLKPGFEKQVQMAKPMKNAGPVKPIKALPPKFAINYYANGKHASPQQAPQPQQQQQQHHQQHQQQPQQHKPSEMNSQWTLLTQPKNAINPVNQVNQLPSN